MKLGLKADKHSIPNRFISNFLSFIY